MASTRSVLSTLLLAASVAKGQDFGGGSRGEDAFSYVQPLDTVILTEYGSSPPVYPSRMFLTHSSGVGFAKNS